MKTYCVALGLLTSALVACADIIGIPDVPVPVDAVAPDGPFDGAGTGDSVAQGEGSTMDHTVGDASHDGTTAPGPDAAVDAQLDGSAPTDVIAPGEGGADTGADSDAGADADADSTTDAPIISCESPSDCPTDAPSGNVYSCGFPTSPLCSVHGECFLVSTSRCELVSFACGCDGGDFNNACSGLPSGYEAAPMLHTGRCTDADIFDGAVE